MGGLRKESDIIKGWNNGLEKPLVSICCITYNHEHFIEETLRGFLIQETDFSFEILIHDDASEDLTAKILKEYQTEYPNIIKVIYQEENQYSKGNKPLAILKPLIKGIYIAVCEGDDYWVDKNKLQIQFEYLEKHKNVVMCYHNATSINSKSEVVKKNTVENKKNYSSVELMNGEGHIPTLTRMLRNIDLPEIPGASFSVNGDRIQLVTIGLLGGEVHYIEGIENSMYRLHEKGVWSSLGVRQRGITQIHTYSILAKYFSTISENEIENTYIKKIVSRLAEVISLKEVFVFFISMFKFKTKQFVKFALRIIKK